MQFHDFFCFQSTDCQIYLNVTTVEEQKMTIELSGQGFCVVCANDHDTIEASDVTVSKKNIQKKCNFSRNSALCFRFEFLGCICQLLRNSLQSSGSCQSWIQKGFW